MRGKNILWIALITVLFSSLLTTAGYVAAAPKPMIFLTPDRLPEHPGAEGVPGDVYDMAINIDYAANVWAVQVKVKFRPYVSVLTAFNFWEGDFMSEGASWPTAFFASPNIFEGSVTFVIFRLPQGYPPQRPGVSGSGTLGTLKLEVLEAGEGPIDVIDTILLDPDGYEISHNTAGSYYHGPYARLIRASMPDGRKVTAGDDFAIETKVKNEGQIPLNVTVACWIERSDDGRTNVLRPGQTYIGGGLGEPRPFEYLYIDEFNEWYYEWVGDPTNVFGEPDGSYIEGDTNAQWASLYSFEDITLGSREIAEITVEVYARYPNGATEAADIDLYGFSSVSAFAWWGSGYGTPDWGWHGMRWTSDSVMTTQPELADETELNNVELLIYNYHGDAPDVLQLDSVRLKVEFSGIVPVAYLTWELAPGEERVLPDIVWQSTEDHIGSYNLVAHIEYTSEFFKWNSWGSVEKDLHFWIVE